MFDDLQTTACEAQRETAYRVDFIAAEFDKARGHDVAYFASHALHSLRTQSLRKGGAVSAARALKIQRAIEAASPHILNLFSDPVDRSRATLALSKAKAVAAFRAKVAPHRTGREAAGLRNRIRHVEWLRNCCHNSALLDEIEEFHDRRAKESRIARQGVGRFS